MWLKKWKNEAEMGQNIIFSGERNLAVGVSFGKKEGEKPLCVLSIHFI